LGPLEVIEKVWSTRKAKKREKVPEAERYCENKGEKWKKNTNFQSEEGQEV
jgi:hypothetical protein